MLKLDLVADASKKRFVSQIEHFFSVAQQPMAGIGQNHSLAQPVKERNSQLRFQSLNLSRDRGLGVTQGVGRAGEA